MKVESKSDAEIEEVIREKTALQVRQQMPTYERSPEFLKALSKTPFIGSFVQFDFQSKVNDKNIIKHIFELVADAKEMRKKAKKETDPEKAEIYMNASTKLMIRSVGKFSGFGTSLVLSTAIYTIMASMYGWDDDDDKAKALRLTMPDYRMNNTLLPLDGNIKGLHSYIDINRIDPQAIYHKYYTAITEDGFNAMLDEVLQPYISVDIFTGAVMDTISNVDKYGRYQKSLAAMNPIEKAIYLFTERIFPSGTVGQVNKIIQASEGGESSEGVPYSVINELANTLFGVKIRTVNMGQQLSSRIRYTEFAEIDLANDNLGLLIDEREKIKSQIERDGAMSFFTQGIPTFAGVNVKDEKDYQDQEKNKFTIYDAHSNKKRESTDEEYKKYQDELTKRLEDKLSVLKRIGVGLNKYGEITIDRSKIVKRKKYEDFTEKEKLNLKSRIKSSESEKIKKEFKF